MARNSCQHIDYIKFGDTRFLYCPWCGDWKDEEGHSFDILHDYWYKVRCLNCSAMPSSSESNTIEAAINFWNKRVQLASLDDAKFLIKKVISDLSKTLE